MFFIVIMYSISLFVSRSIDDNLYIAINLQIKYNVTMLCRIKQIRWSAGE